jgi:hypothetical protein
MPLYRIHRMKDTPRQHFRWAPHTSGETVAKLRDYEPGTTLEAPTAYAAWVALRGSATPLDIGDILESEGELRILKYIGFEEARWFVPDAAAHREAGDRSAAPVAGEVGTAV